MDKAEPDTQDYTKKVTPRWLSQGNLSKLQETNIFTINFNISEKIYRKQSFKLFDNFHNNTQTRKK